MNLGVVPEERVALAKHQMEILERRFPNHDCQLYALGSPMCYIFGNNKNYPNPYLFQISFRSSSVEILLSIGDEDKEIEERTILDYADPRFTDDIIPDMIKEWEVACPPEAIL